MSILNSIYLVIINFYIFITSIEFKLVGSSFLFKKNGRLLIFT